MERENNQRKVFGLDVHPGSFTSAEFHDQTGNPRDLKPIKLQHKILMDNFDQWLLKFTAPGDILVMESLSISFNLVKRIEKQGRTGIVLDSKKVGQLGKSYLKNDKVDAIKIAKIYLTGFDDRVWVPDTATIERRDILFAYRNADKDKTRSCTRLWAYLTQNGIIVSKKIKSGYKKDVESVIRLKDWTRPQEMIIRSYWDDYQNAAKKKNLLERLMAEETVSDPQMISLQQFHGVRAVSAYAIMAIIGNIDRFANPKKLVAYIGLQPKVSDSGDQEHSGTIARDGRRYLRKILMNCAKSIIQYCPQDHPLAKWARKLLFRKNNNVVTVAVARKLITAIWYVLKGFGSPLTELSKMIETKLIKLAIKIGTIRRRELGYQTISTFVQKKGELLINSA